MEKQKRTSALWADFADAFSRADVVVITDIYPAGEEPIAGASLENLAAAVRRAVSASVDVVPRLDEVPRALAAAAKPGDVVIILGAGSIGSVPDKVIELLGARS